LLTRSTVKVDLRRVATYIHVLSLCYNSYAVDL